MPVIPRLAFSIHDGFSLFGYGVARDLLRMANHCTGVPLAVCVTASASTGPVRSSCGAEVLADTSWRDLGPVQALFACSYNSRTPGEPDPKLLGCIRSVRRHGGLLFGLGSGVWPLAAAGVLDGGRAAADPGEIAALRSRFPKVSFTLAPFVTDGPVATCIGGDSVTDMMLDYLATTHGPALAENVRRQVFLKPARSEALMRSLGYMAPATELDPRLSHALQLLDQNTANPPNVAEVCAMIGLSERTLGRLTKAAFGCSPAILSLRLRLHHAAIMLSHSPRSVKHIASACGFASPAHFSAAFKRRFGQTPTAHRQKGWKR